MSTTEQTVHAAPFAVHASHKFIGWAVTIAVPVLLWFLPLPLQLNARHAIAISSFMIIAWITEVLPHAVTGMAGCYLFWALHIVDFGTAFSGFADQTPWFLFGAALIGMMASKSGLARRLAYLVMRRVGAGYSRLLLGLILSSFLLTLLVPSGIACVVIMAAVAVGLMDVFGLSRGSNVGRGIFVTLTYTAGIFDKMVIAGAIVDSCARADPEAHRHRSLLERMAAGVLAVHRGDRSWSCGGWFAGCIPRKSRPSRAAPNFWTAPWKAWGLGRPSKSVRSY